MAQSIAPDLMTLRAAVLQDILARSYKDGRLGANVRKDSVELNTFRRELMFVSLMAWEYADAAGPMGGDKALLDIVTASLERIGGRFPQQGMAAGRGGPGTYFCLVPFTRSLLCLEGRVDEPWRRERIVEAQALFALAAQHMDRTHEYCNARALECASVLNLHRLSGRQEYLDRCVECLDELLKRQYPCGAQPYHTGLWVWGRKPAQVYQYLAGSLMLYVARRLGRSDAIEYVRRMMDYSLLASNRRGEAFVTTFEGLHKAHSLACAGRQWVMAAVLGDERFAGLARSTYEIYADGIIDDPMYRHENFRHEALTEALEMGVASAPGRREFVPPVGPHALEDISTVFVHEKNLDLSMTLLTGYSALAEGECGNVKLLALTPELTDQPTYVNCGTDALRAYWQKPSEQIECSSAAGRSVLSGWVYTKWDRNGTKDFRHLHNRRLAVTMTYDGGEMVLDFETIKNWQAEPVPSRLLLLLIARPFDQGGVLSVAGREHVTPPAESSAEFSIEAPVGPVRFAAGDGSAIEIIPEICTGRKITAYRPGKQEETIGHDIVKPANEGSLRLAFEGRDVLDRGRYRIRFVTGG